MRIIYDPIKSARNIKERGLSFERAHDFDWNDAIFEEDVRYPCPEKRFVALGFLDNSLHSLCFTHIAGGGRVISFRVAYKKEVKRYEQAALDR